MLDAQKQRLFDVLGDRASDATGVYDVFAGSGGLGLEALSRGALRATFVERGRSAAACVRENVARCGFSEQAVVLDADAFKLDYARLTHDADLVFFDPPFPLFESSPEYLDGLLLAAAATPRVLPEATLMWRAPEEAPPLSPPSGLRVVDRRVAGRSVLYLLSKAPPP
jgi:16S rRNA (guanine966-N2)-methyltransferase